MKTCTVDGCTIQHYAKGLCRKHYARTQPRTPDKPTITPCAYCGKILTRWGGGYKAKYGHFCDEACKSMFMFGVGWSERLPADHMALVIGQSCEWVAPKAPLMPIACGWCGHTFLPTRSTSRFCKHACLSRFKKAARRGRQFNAIGTYSWAEIARLWVAFGKCCAYCQTPTPLTEIQAEHVMPLSRGGANNLTNLLPSCALCNSDKRDLLLPEWAVDRAMRGKPTVCTTWDDTDPLYMHLTSTLTGSLVAA